ncbi:hypothetical protein K0M31_017046 [Melipona bicolor]|uniref:Uncharacterized protein n=1 Tax=Melipona bicolor TaxID=60889 RepID=A0AA40KE45_9HYME|nr:hypothetical protein K0M31_017046 [Melipona bicolor]
MEPETIESRLSFTEMFAIQLVDRTRLLVSVPRRKSIPSEGSEEEFCGDFENGQGSNGSHDPLPSDGPVRRSYKDKKLSTPQYRTTFVNKMISHFHKMGKTFQVLIFIALGIKIYPADQYTIIPTQTISQQPTRRIKTRHIVETEGSRCQQWQQSRRSVGKRSSRFSRFAVEAEGGRNLEGKPLPGTAFGARGMKDEKEIEFRSRGLRCTPARGFTLRGLWFSLLLFRVLRLLTDLPTYGLRRTARKKPDILQPAPRANRSNEIILYYSDFANLY